MIDAFETTWDALVENGSSRRNREATKRFWDTLSADQQRRAYERITRKVREGRFVQYDPIRAIKENCRNIPGSETQLSYNEYYMRFGTTEEQGGWEKVYLEKEQKTIYVSTMVR